MLQKLTPQLGASRNQGGQLLDRKSLRAVTGKTADWGELAKDCVAFANAVGGRLLIGIEDGEELPPPGQQIPDTLPDLLRRNEHLARLCHDLKLMEREGSGFDAIYDVLLSQGRPAPRVEEGADWVRVTIARAAPDRHVLEFIAKAGETYPLSQRERITLGLLARHEALTAKELADHLELTGADALRPWLARLLDWQLIGQSGRTQATRYFVQPDLLRSMAFPAVTTLKRIEDHRLRALVLEDLARYPRSAFGEVHARIGTEIPARRLRTLLLQLVEAQVIQKSGNLKGTRYLLAASDLLTEPMPNPDPSGQ